MLDLVTVVLFILVFTLTYWYLRKPHNLPPGPIRWPIIGFIPTKRYKSRQDFFEELQVNYGKICCVWQGSKVIVILSDYKLIREALVDNAEYLSERPNDLFFVRRISKQKGIIWDEHNWRSIRKFVISSLRDFGAGSASLEGKVLEECDVLMQEFLKQNGQPFDSHRLIINAVSNIICSIIYGQRYDYDDPVFTETMGVMEEMFKNSVMLTPLNHYPWLAAMAWYLGIANPGLRRTAYMEKFIQNEVDQHRESFEPSNCRDFIDLYLKAESDPEEDYRMTTDDLQAVIFDLFAAGTETTGTTLRWFIVYMIHYPEVQKKCRHEIHKVIGTARSPQMSDRSQLVYTEATLLELQRISNIAPRALPHSSRVTLTLGGYTIPANSMVVCVLQSAHLDREVWGDPDVLRPERWIQDGQLDAKNPAFMPFSLGRRQCPGEQMAKMELFLFAVTLLQRFELRMADEMPSLEGELGVTFTPKPFLMRAVPLED